MRYFAFLCSVFPLIAFGELSMKAVPGNPDSIFRNGEPVVFRFHVTEDGKPKKGLLFYEIEREGFIPRETRFAETDENGVGEIRLASGKPGSIKVRATLCSADKKPAKVLNQQKKSVPLSRIIGAMIDPEKLSSPFPEPKDYDEFWNRARRELASVPIKVLKKEEFSSPEKLKGKARLFDVQIAAPGPRPVSGILGIPVNAAAKSLPIVLLVHGAGVRSSQIPHRTAEYNAIMMDINAHGLPNRQPAKYYRDLEKGELKDYLLRVGKEEPETGYFRYMFLRGLRALEYLRTLPEWDGKNIIISGGSQGGAQALVIAGLDPHITFCRANIPWLTVPAAPAEGYFQVPGWARQIHLDKNGKVLNPEAIRNLSYFDAANAVRRMKAQCFISYGIADHICPPSGVWMTYNNIPGKKIIEGAPQRGHQSYIGSFTLAEYLKKLSADKKK